MSSLLMSRRQNLWSLVQTVSLGILKKMSLTYAKDLIDSIDSYKIWEFCLIHVLHGAIMSTVYPHVSLNKLVYFAELSFSYRSLSGVARTFGARGQRTLRGPSPCFITLFLWPLSHIHPYSGFAHVYLYYMTLDTALFNQYISHDVFWKFWSLWWRDGGNGGPLMTQW